MEQDTQTTDIARILDANANRAREGLRVIEEHVRFSLNSTPLQERLKNLRHKFCKSFSKLEASGNAPLVSSRDTAGDVGTTTTTLSEMKRNTSTEIAKASVKRLQEALRVMEEYGKIISVECAKEFEQIRYLTYELEADIFCNQSRKERLANAKLYVLITESLASADAETVCKETIAGGADIIQMREKNMEDGEFLNKAEKLNNLCRKAGVLFIINDRPHICRLIDADGIHTGLGDLPVNLSRKIIGRDRILGRSTHCPDDLQKAFEDGADYAGVGPVYETKTKEHRSAVGLEYVKHAVENSKIPYYCIGSVNRKTINKVIEAGANTVAICTGIIAAKNIAEETAWYKEQLNKE
jgi:thiamine-phosphate pyrophosphorylase